MQARPMAQACTLSPAQPTRRFFGMERPLTRGREVVACPPTLATSASAIIATRAVSIARRPRCAANAGRRILR